MESVQSEAFKKVNNHRLQTRAVNKEQIAHFIARVVGGHIGEDAETMENDATIGDAEELKQLAEGFAHVGVGADVADGAETLEGGDDQPLRGVVEPKGKRLDAAGVDDRLGGTRARLRAVRQRLQRAARRVQQLLVVERSQDGHQLRRPAQLHKYQLQV